MHYDRDMRLVSGAGNRAPRKDRTLKGRIARAQAEVRQLKAQGYEFARKSDGTYGWRKKNSHD